MTDKQFFNNLSATYADIRKLDVKKINLKGKNILEYIKESSTIVLDERGTQADDTLDIWNSYVTKDEEGNVIINRDAKPFAHTYNTISSTQQTTIKSAVKVIDNEVLGADNAHLMFWQTGGLTDGTNMFKSCGNLSEFSSDLSSLINGGGMFNRCENLTTFISDISNVTNGEQMFDCCAFTSFYSDLPNLTSCYAMFANCPLSLFSSDLSNVTDGKQMFSGCSQLTKFFSDLPSLTDSYRMFEGCSSLTSFASDLSSLTSANYMFQNCTELATFSSDLPSLTSGYNTFANCSKLSAFSSDLSSLTYGNYMFDGCSKLTSFVSGLSSLTSGVNMFSDCALDAPSVANIIHFIPQRDTKPTTSIDYGKILIGIGITNTDAAKQTFAQDCECDDWTELNKEFDDKNWAVYWQFTGPASYSLRDPRPSTAVYTKLEELIMPTEEETETPRYEFTSQDGSKFYNIHWYHDSNTNNEGYDYFESLEEAISAYGVLPKA